jgi:hypothetical protein
MSDALLLTAATASALLGMAWLALAMDVHWEQVRPDPASPRIALTLRVLGAAALAGSLVLCLAVDHATMASLVWLMCLAAAALTVAFTLSSRPRWLAPLVAWLPAARRTA